MTAYRFRAEPNTHTIGPAQQIPKAPPGFYYLHRHGFLPIGTLPPETQVVVCKRMPVAKLAPGLIPEKFFWHLERNQKIPTCCRHPENHEIDARKTHPDEHAPDVYIFYCLNHTPHRRHIIWCLGGGDERPFWEVR